MISTVFTMGRINGNDRTFVYSPKGLLHFFNENDTIYIEYNDRRRKQVVEKLQNSRVFAMNVVLKQVHADISAEEIIIHEQMYNTFKKYKALKYTSVHDEIKSIRVNESILIPMKKFDCNLIKLQSIDINKMTINVLKCLDIIHREKYVHLDVKPDNILFKKEDGGDGLYVLSDYDTLTPISSAFSYFKNNMIIGTYTYMSPYIMINKYNTVLLKLLEKMSGVQTNTLIDIARDNVMVCDIHSLILTILSIFNKVKSNNNDTVQLKNIIKLLLSMKNARNSSGICQKINDMPHVIYNIKKITI